MKVLFHDYKSKKSGCPELPEESIFASGKFIKREVYKE
jgi:hypothetical protein